MSADRLRSAAVILSAARGADHPALMLASSALASCDPAVIDAAAAHLERTIGDVEEACAKLQRGYLDRLSTYPIAAATVLEVNATRTGPAGGVADAVWSHRVPLALDLPSRTFVRLIIGPGASTASAIEATARLNLKLKDVLGNPPHDGSHDRALITTAAAALEAGRPVAWTPYTGPVLG